MPREFACDPDGIQRITLHVTVRIDKQQLRTLHSHAAFLESSLANAMRAMLIEKINETKAVIKAAKLEKAFTPKHNTNNAEAGE